MTTHPTTRHAGEEAAPESFFAAFARDLDRLYIYHEPLTRLTRLSIYLTTQGLWALLVYRFGRSLRTRPIPVLGLVLWPVFRVLEALVRATTGIHLDVDSCIGPGLYIAHFGAVFVGPGVVIGENCGIGQTCSVSGDGSWPDTPAPVLGDRVYMGIGSKVIGPVVVGDDAALGANAVVVTDLPPSATAVGNPASVINSNGSARFIRLRPVETSGN